MAITDFWSEMTLAGWLTLLTLAALSITMVGVSLDLRTRLRKRRLRGDWLLKQLWVLTEHREKGTDLRLRDYLVQLERPLPHLLGTLESTPPTDLDTGDYLIETYLARQRNELEQGLSWLGTVAVISPFVGLFGTVVGITKTFADIAASGEAGLAVVAAGVSEALVATALGLMIAIVSVVLNNQFRSAVDRELSQWQTAAQQFLCWKLQALDSLAPEGWDSAWEQHSTESAETFLALERGAASPGEP